MTELNNDIRELSIDELDIVTGGSPLSDFGNTVKARVEDVYLYFKGLITGDPYCSRI
jgi:hypothetical protein